jgi:GNAT superfamily N-acetyltransferase
VTLPAGLVARRPGPDDAAAVLALVEACDRVAVGRSDATLTQVASDLAWPGYDRVGAGWLVDDPSGRAVGWLWTDDDTARDRVFLDPYAQDPQLVQWLVDRGVEYASRLAGERGRPVEVAAGVYDRDELMTAALVSAGMRPVRRFWRMEIDLSAESKSDDLGVTPGVAVRAVGESEADQRLLHRLLDEAFRDHWNSVERSYQEWRRMMDASNGRDPSQWWVADVDGEPAGALLGDESEAEHGVTVVRSLGVVRPYRGRGAAKALLRTAFTEARRRGRRAAALMVDSESPTGATRLYASVGMTVDKVIVSWRGEVRP